MNQSSVSFKSLLLIGLGFFAVSASWAAYNAYLPLILSGAGLTTAGIGVVMALDNVFGLTVQPLFGMISDRTRSPWGRRLPFALICAPIAAIALMLMPVAANIGVSILIILVVIYTLTMAFWRAPIVALMPDLVAPEGRSRANGVINFMGSLGNVLIFGIGGLLVARFAFAGPFTLAGVLMIVAVVLLVVFVHENPAFRSPKLSFISLRDPLTEHGSISTDVPPVSLPDDATRALAELPTSAPATPAIPAEPLPAVGIWTRIRNLIAPPLSLTPPQKRSLLFILAAMFVYTMGANAVDTFVTLYLHQELGVPESQVTLNLLPYLAASILFAIPAGFIGQWIGRRNSMAIGLAGSAVLFMYLWGVTDVATLRLLMPIYGVLWITVIVNALPLTVELGGVEHTGTLTAYYYLAGSSGAVISPILFGVIRDLTGDFSLIFVYAAVAFAIASIVLVGFVRHGEAGDSATLGVAAA
ncbi:MAG: MFS transporter [Ruaniaceae bacterium]|nr:MFS transporter [Ruaniaceae bacterium]